MSNIETSVQGSDINNQTFINKLVQIIEENISDPEFSVDQLSKKVNMSRSTLYRKLISISNQNPRELIKIVRFKKAAQLLKQGDLNVTEVMFAVGFTHSRFSEYFKDIFGVLPSEYGKK
jgi:AraC-like DNA-binding protein